MGMIFKELGRARCAQTTIGAADTVYTNPTLKDSIVTRINVHNEHTSEVTVYIGYVPDNAGTADTMDTLDIYYQVALDAGEGMDFNAKIAMTDTNDTIKAYATVADKVVVHVIGFTTADQS